MTRRSLAVLVLALVLAGCSAETALTPTAPGAIAGSDAAADAQGSRRRPARINAVTLNVRALDSVDSSAVFGAIVRVQGKSAEANAQGFASVTGLQPGAATLTVERWGYAPVSQSVNITPGTTSVDVRLAPKPVINLTDATGGQHRLDFELANFVTAGPLTSYTVLSPAEFCRADGTTLQADKSQIARITGPATEVTGSPCCPNGGVALQIGLTLKSGENLTAYIAECRFYKYDFSGRNRNTGAWEYLGFRNISEIRFP